MSDFALTQISNVMLGTTDLARSLEFYRGTLGLTVQFEMPEFVFLNAGGVTLSLSEAHAKLATPVAGGTEIVFGVGDVTAAHEALRARGVEFLNTPRNVTGDQWAANFRDPERAPALDLRTGKGIVVCLSVAPSRAAATRGRP